MRNSIEKKKLKEIEDNEELKKNIELELTQKEKEKEEKFKKIQKFENEKIKKLENSNLEKKLQFSNKEEKVEEFKNIFNKFIKKFPHLHSCENIIEYFEYSKLINIF